MSEIQITYEMVRERHPSELEQIKALVARSGSKYKKSPIEQWQFFYQTIISGTIMRGDEFMRKLQSGETDSEKEAKLQWERTATLEEWVQRELDRTHISLAARLVRGGGVYPVGLSSVPPEVHQEIEGYERHSMEERHRLDSLNPEQREVETQELLAQLRGTPGFTEIQIGEDGRAKALMEGMVMDLSPSGDARIQKQGSTSKIQQKGQGKPEEKPKKRDKWSGGAIRV